ncbi:MULTISPECIES: PCP reductase family protein [unclassified Nocardiopsis]|uniref:PCP reductase family protein n=1 Tax=unclassified Nocardiopsis TaxID=2649073 RepID=UPI00093E87ED|nr:PCP reductase family protein [Nocardiopsis sp. TSRI0078]
MNGKTPQEISAEFAAMMLGGTVSYDPPPADSPLGRLEAYAEEHGEDAVTPEIVRLAREGKL